MHPDEIDRKWSETAYVWVRPAPEKVDWEAITKAWSDRGTTDWRPAVMFGFSDDGWAYNTMNDSRRISIIGETSAFALTCFEIGGLIPDPNLVLGMRDDPTTNAVSREGIEGVRPV